ncbi:MAG: hypothetical protein ACR2QE_16700 [Acidimicrobiales bacterium]
MRFLLAEMLLLLVAAFALGLGVGALLGRAQRRPDDQTPVEAEVARLRAEMRAHGLDPDPPNPDMEVTTLGELSPAPDPLDVFDLDPADPGDVP